MGRSKISDVECAGSVDTSSTRLPAWLAASAIADADVVLPTPPLPPKNSTRLSMSRVSAAIRSVFNLCLICGSAAGQRSERGSIHAHAFVPEMKLLEQVG